MAYADTNFKTSKALKQAIQAGEKVTVHQSGLGDVPTNGTVFLEGPHFPEPHKWYAQATMKDGFVESVK